MGIGTLIVFIAMVLVAAIAAGVLINTAGFLQTQAEDTGTESTEQVADNLNVVTTVGEVDPENKVDEIRLGVQPAAGAEDVNLAELTLQYVSDDEFANIVVGYDNNENKKATGDTSPSDLTLNANKESFLVDAITAENEDDIVMTDEGDRYELLLPLDENATSWPYLPSEHSENEGNNPELENVDPNEVVTLLNDKVVEIKEATDGGSTDVTEDFEIENSDTGEVRYTGGSSLTDVTIKYVTKTTVNGVELGELTEGEEVEITITTEVGAQTVAFMQVPDSLAGQDDGDVVTL